MQERQLFNSIAVRNTSDDIQVFNVNTVLSPLKFLLWALSVLARISNFLALIPSFSEYILCEKTRFYLRKS